MDSLGAVAPRKADRRWHVRPNGSNWGDFGENDEYGRLNLITDERRRAATREVIEGRVFVLSLPLDLPGPGIHPPFRHPPKLSETAGHKEDRSGKTIALYRCTQIILDQRAAGASV